MPLILKDTSNLLNSLASVAGVDPTRATTYERNILEPGTTVHEFQTTYVLLYKGRTQWGPDPAFPHIIAVTCDTSVPDDRILRSELLLAVCILRSNLALHPWLEHHTFPVRIIYVTDSAL